MLQTILNDIVTYGPPTISVLLMVIGAASAAAAALPKAPTGANPVWVAMRAAIDYVGANWGNAKNAK